MPGVSVPPAANTGRALALAGGLYLAWVGATYLLEGRLHTLLRPDATVDRITYALVANVLIGLVGGAWVLRAIIRLGVVSPRQGGFGSPAHAAVGAAVGAALGLALYLVQGPPSAGPVVLLNAFAQVLVVTLAEVVVCWSVVGAAVESLLARQGRAVAVVGAALVASALFGAYHFAHSPPFNTVGMVLLLTAVGLLTSAFFFVSRDVYGTAAFHNFAGVLGVVRALSAAGALAPFERPMAPILVMGAVAVGVLAAAHRLWLRRPLSAGPGEPA